MTSIPTTSGSSTITLFSGSGVPPETLGDLKLPVVEPFGDLNENALQTPHGGNHSVEAVEDLSKGQVGEGIGE